MVQVHIRPKFIQRQSLGYYMKGKIGKNVVSFFSSSLVSVISLMSTGKLFQALGATARNAYSNETNLDCGMTRSFLPSERRETQPGTSATEVTNSVKYDGARPLITWYTKRQSLNLIFSAIGNQWSADHTRLRGLKFTNIRAAALTSLWSGANVEAGKCANTELQ